MKIEFKSLDGVNPEKICGVFRFLVYDERSNVCTYGLFDTSLYEWIIGDNIWKKICETYNIYLYPLNIENNKFMDIDIAYIDSVKPNRINLKRKDDNTMKKQLNSIFGLDSIKRYCESDVTATRIAYNNMYKNIQMCLIDNVIFNDPATIILWKDGTKTVVKCGEGEVYDPEKGMAMAISKKVLGNHGNYYETFKKWLPKEEKKEKVKADTITPTTVKSGRYATVKELSKKVGVSESTIRGQIRKGQFPGAIKQDGAWLIPISW